MKPLHYAKSLFDLTPVAERIPVRDSLTSSARALIDPEIAAILCDPAARDVTRFSVVRSLQAGAHPMVQSLLTLLRAQRCVALLPAIGERFDMLLTATRCESTRTALEDVMATIEPRRSAPSVTVARDPESASDNAQPRPMRMRSARKRRSASLGTQSQG